MKKTARIKDINLLLGTLHRGISNLSQADRKRIFEQIERILTGYAQTHSSDEIKNVKDVLISLADISQCHLFAAYIEPSIFKQLGKDLSMSEDPEMIAAYLDIFRSPKFLYKIYDDESWSDLILDLLHRCNYTYPKMFFERTVRYKKKILFTVLAAGKSTDYSWSKVARSKFISFILAVFFILFSHCLYAWIAGPSGKFYIRFEDRIFY